MSTKGGTIAEWVGVSERISSGEFDYADDSTREALEIGLKSCLKATSNDAIKTSLERLSQTKSKTEKRRVRK